jgi:hypothetical protein
VGTGPYTVQPPRPQPHPGSLRGQLGKTSNPFLGERIKRLVWYSPQPTQDIHRHNGNDQSTRSHWVREVPVSQRYAARYTHHPMEKRKSAPNLMQGIDYIWVPDGILTGVTAVKEQSR